MEDSMTIDRFTDNTTASRLGEIATAAGDLARSDVGDSIDRGLILLRLLNEAGFMVVRGQN